ncbi:MAG: molybdate ABC transporter substrate-binding protein [Nitrospiria bacterium]
MNWGSFPTVSRRFLSLLIVSILQWSPALCADQSPTNDRLLIAAASSLRFTMDDIVAEFTKSIPADVEMSYSASGNLLAQILAGAPFDLFLSADEAYPKQVIEKEFADPDAFFRYGSGLIVLWVPDQSPIDIVHEGINGLMHPSVKKIVLANPRHAPYGMAAMEALKNMDFFDRLDKKFVFSDNIFHAAAFIRRGDAQIGILAYSLALSEPLQASGRFWVIPSHLYSPMLHGGLILGNTKDRALATAFVDFLKKGRGREILQDYGYLKKGGSN